MLIQLVALLHLSLSDHVTSGGFATAFPTGGSLPYLHFLMAMRTSTDKLGIFHAIPPLMMVPNSFLIFHLVLNRDLAPSISLPKSRAIYDLDASKSTCPDRIAAIVIKMCSPELSPVLSKLYNKCLAESCFLFFWTKTGGKNASFAVVWQKGNIDWKCIVHWCISIVD